MTNKTKVLIYRIVTSVVVSVLAGLAILILLLLLSGCSSYQEPVPEEVVKVVIPLSHAARYIPLVKEGLEGIGYEITVLDQKSGQAVVLSEYPESPEEDVDISALLPSGKKVTGIPSNFFYQLVRQELVGE